MMILTMGHRGAFRGVTPRKSVRDQRRSGKCGDLQHPPSELVEDTAIGAAGLRSGTPLPQPRVPRHFS
jgi:hypothetical protein